MESISSDVYQTPALISLLSIMSAMTFVISSYYWFFSVIKTPRKTTLTFTKTIWIAQLYNFLFVMILSIIIGAYNYYVADKALHIGGEIGILLLSLLLCYKFNKSKIPTYIKTLFLIGTACFLGWILTSLIWLGFSQIFKTIFVMERSEYNIMTLFASGLLWNVPIIIMFQKILKDDDMRPHLKGFKMHKFIWPIMLAYLALLMPLAIQDFVNSKEWKKIENHKPIRRV